MKIIHFIPRLTKGGAERVVVDLANEANKRGHQVSLVAWTPAPSELGTGALRQGIAIRYLDSKGGGSHRAYIRLLPWIVRNRQWLLGHDVIHCHLSMGSAFAAAVQLLRGLGRRRGPAVVETYHAVGVAIPAFDRWAHARLLTRRDAVAFMAEDPYWTRYRTARQRRLMRTIRNGVDFPAAPDAAECDRYRRKVAKVPDDAIIVASVGRLVPERRPELLLETFARLTAVTDRNVHLLLAGEGPMRAHLESEARRRGLESRVHLPGLVIDPAQVFGITDLYLTVNVGATTGIAALEAASSGCPVVAIQLDDTHRRTGSEWIWASPEPRQLAMHIAELLGDPERLRRTADRQRRFARKNYSVKTMADAYERLYHEALAARGIAAAPAR